MTTTLAPTPAAPRPASALEQAKPAHARWSRANREFLEFVERNPACLRRASYAPLYEDPSLVSFSVQPWPLFFDAARLRELSEMSVGLDRLMKGVTERLLADPVRAAAFYHTRGSMDGAPTLAREFSEDMIEILADEPNGIQAAHSRADYIETADGLKFLEFNAGGFIGGLHTDHLCAQYLRCEPTARFLRETGRRAAPMGVCRALFRHVVDDTVRLGAWTEGDFNVAMVVRPHTPEILAQHSEGTYTRDLCAALRQGGAGEVGRVILCSLDELTVGRDGVTVHGEPVHAVIEQHNGQGDIRAVFRAFKMGYVNLFSGPIGDLLSDKRNLALLSEHAGSNEFTAAERSLIDRHVPWTRRVQPGHTTFRGRPLRLPEDLPAQRENLVLKKASSIGGDFVVVGRYRTPDEWDRTIARALWEQDWVVQEYLETLPYCFQNEHAGASAHELVWGLFVFGEHFGGVHLRMQTTGRAGGVVNTRQGADIGAGLALLG
ncbi:hypothetical protein [Longimicrobium sp.]|uniref:hypothetical protein n=1 Tax=Longimicrobium sp. TaxID=2029185 RepID=UPI003B3B3700